MENNKITGTNHLYITSITGPDVQNGPGLRLTIWIQGCSHNCPGCQNMQTHHYVTDKYEEKYDYIQCYEEADGGDLILNPILKDILKTKLLQKDTDGNYVYDGVTFSGGDPLSQSPNAIKELEALINYIAYQVRDDEYITDIWLFTGYKFEWIEQIDYLNDFIHDAPISVLVDGPFIERLKPTDKNTLKYRGSTNQRLIDVWATLVNNRIILYEDKTL